LCNEHSANVKAQKIDQPPIDQFIYSGPGRDRTYDQGIMSPLL